MEVRAESKKIRFQVDMDFDEYDEFVKSVNNLFEYAVANKGINPISPGLIEPIVTLKNVMTGALKG